MKPITVAIFDSAGNPVRWRGGGRHASVESLSYGSSLPGGFADASIQISSPSARLLPVQVGHVLQLRSGLDIVWWGWVEDIQRKQSGARETVTLIGMGPWQLFQQRLVSEAFSDVVSTYVLRDVIRLYLPELSVDSSQLVNTQVPLTRTWENAKASDIAKTVVDAGTADDADLLFAIWQPAGERSQVMQSSNLLQDPEMEHQNTYWTKGSDVYFQWSQAEYVSYRQSLKMLENASGGAYQTDRVAVAASTVYVFEYWVMWSAYAGMTSSGRFDWYNSLNVLISTTYSTTHTSDGATLTWQHFVDTVTSPAGAVTVTVHIQGAVGSGGGSARNQWVDDVRFYPQTTALAEDAKPRAELWARDLSDYDYVLYTKYLAAGLELTDTTRDLANRVLAKYGSSYTDPAEDATSEADYRQRDAVVDAGDVALADAEAVRDTYLARHKDPGTEVRQFTLRDDRALRLPHGQRVSPALVRAGDRVLVADGRLAGSIILLEQVRYDNGEVTCRPESYADATRLLARV